MLANLRALDSAAFLQTLNLGAGATKVGEVPIEKLNAWGGSLAVGHPFGATGTIQWKPTSHTELTIDGVYSKYDQDTTTAGITTIGLDRNGTNARATILTG